MLILQDGANSWPQPLMTVHACNGCKQTDAHPLFERLSDEELEADVAAQLLDNATEEGQKVARNSGQVHT